MHFTLYQQSGFLDWAWLTCALTLHSLTKALLTQHPAFWSVAGAGQPAADTANTRLILSY
jgi:hypothetical protein